MRRSGREGVRRVRAALTAAASPDGLTLAPGGGLQTGFGYAGAIDGIFGPTTEAVVRQYQTTSGLPSTGVMDERTWMASVGAAGATLESLCGLTSLGT